MCEIRKKVRMSKESCVKSRSRCVISRFCFIYKTFAWIHKRRVVTRRASSWKKLKLPNPIIPVHPPAYTIYRFVRPSCPLFAHKKHFEYDMPKKNNLPVDK